MKYNIDTTNVIDPLEYMDQPLWCVCGHESFPTILACKINDKSGKPVIWGYSVYKRSGSYRTLGETLDNWRDAQNMVYFFNQQEHALDFLAKLTTPLISKKKFSPYD